MPPSQPPHIRPSDDQEGSLELLDRADTAKPPLYRVFMLNDDYTPMEFVVHVLRAIFHKTETESVAIMLAIHQKGQGTAGTYPRGIAETKVRQVAVMAQKAGFPLLTDMEKVES